MLKEGQIVQVKPRLKSKTDTDGFLITKDMEDLKGQYIVIEKRTDKDRYYSQCFSWKEKCFTKDSIEEHNFIKGKSSDGDYNENDIVKIDDNRDSAVLKKAGIWYLDYFKVQGETHDRGGRLYEETGWNLSTNLEDETLIIVKKAYNSLEDFLKEKEKPVESKDEEIIEGEQESFEFNYMAFDKLSKSIDKLSKKIDRDDPFKEAMTKAIIEKGKDLAIEDLKERLKTELDSYIEETYGTLPKKVIIEKEGEPKKEITGLFHKKFEEICKIVSKGIPLMLVGGAGAGKNHTLEQVAKALGLDFYTTNAVTQEYKLTGFIDANGRYHETQFYKSYTGGGLFFLDEMDASSPEALIILNGAIANGYFDFPIGRMTAHKDFRVVCAGNTYGTGADMVYVGRNVLDGATLDRFVVVQFDYDEDVEKTLAYDLDLFKFIRDLRDSVNKAGLRYIISMRALINATKLLEIGIDKKTILETTIIKNMQKDDLNLVVGKLDTGNPWYSEIKRLCD